jgi:hypothetical protein
METADANPASSTKAATASLRPPAAANTSASTPPPTPASATKGAADALPSPHPVLHPTTIIANQIVPPIRNGATMHADARLVSPKITKKHLQMTVNHVNANLVSTG